MAGNVNLALLHAAASGSLTVVKSALKEGADVNYEQTGAIGPGTNLSFTPLCSAAYGGHVHVVKLLLRKGASLVKRVSVQGWAPLHIAALYGRCYGHQIGVAGKTEVVEVLMHHGATVDIIGGLDRVTPLGLACKNGHVDTVRRLIEFGARVASVMWYCEELEKNGKRGRDRKKEECLKLMRDALETRLLRCCNPTCNKPGYTSDLKRCAACKLTRYCSRECQRQHWSGGHKKCCGLDQYLYP